VQGKKRIIQCIIKSNLDDSSSDFLNQYLKWKSISPENISGKMAIPNLPPDESKCYVFNNPKLDVLTEIRNNYWDTLVIGDINKENKIQLFRLGYSKIWTELNLLNNIPLESFIAKDKSLWIWIYTGIASLDIIFKEIFESIGHKVFLPLQWIDLLESIPNQKPDCVILNWDSALESNRNCIELIDKSINRSNHLPLILGLKNFQASGLAKNLMNGISRISNIIMTEKQLLHSIIQSLFINSKSLVQLERRDILQWDKAIRFQLKNIELIEEDMISKVNRSNIELFYFAKQFSWLLDEELFH